LRSDLFLGRYDFRFGSLAEISERIQPCSFNATPTTRVWADINRSAMGH